MSQFNAQATLITVGKVDPARRSVSRARLDPNTLRAGASTGIGLRIQQVGGSTHPGLRQQ